MPTGIYKRKPPFLRFLEKIKINSDYCWEWTGSLKPQGYGEMSLNGKNIYAHRYSYEFFNNKKIQRGMCVDHICNNRKCVNPYHLAISSYSDNIKRGKLPSINKRRGLLVSFKNEAKRIYGMREINP